MAHVEEISPRPASLKPLDVPPRLVHALKSQGVQSLYSHQAQALELARAGRDLAVATPTASGSSSTSSVACT